MGEYIDLHLHTTFSDGTLTPSQIVDQAKKCNLKAIAITDHDTINGVEEALRSGEKEGLEVIPGVELSAEFDREMHLLGLFIDYKNKKLHNILEILKTHRENRNPLIVERLNNVGIDITYEEVKNAAHNRIIGRPHIANILINKGYVKDMHEAFDKYLGVGKIGYVKKDRIPADLAINIIKEANGIPILAHPGHFRKTAKELDKFIFELKEIGLMGVEAYHSDHDEETTKALVKIADKHNLLISGGSDFHGEHKKHIFMGTGYGNMKIEYNILENLKKVFN